MTANIKIEKQGEALVRTLDDPETRNAISKEVYKAATPDIIGAGTDPDIRAVVITGANGVFCSGGNVGNFPESRNQPRSVSVALISYLHNWIKAIRACSKPVIAAVEKVAASAGISLALACDLIVSSRKAKCVVAYVKIGLSRR